MSTAQRGDPVHCRMEKWGGLPHWSYRALWLGSDEQGDWLGFPAGTRYQRPGRLFTAAHDSVGLVPAPVDGARPWWLATFHAPGGTPWPALGGEPAALYVDMTTPARWHRGRSDEPPTLTAVDLDLDVVRAAGPDARPVVDDEDEFADHQVRLGYPPEVVAAARASCAAVVAAVDAGDPPYDESHLAWLEVLAGLSASSGP